MIPQTLIDILTIESTVDKSLWIAPIVLLSIWLAIFSKEQLAKRITKFVSIGLLSMICFMMLVSFMLSLKNNHNNDNWYEQLKGVEINK